MDAGQGTRVGTASASPVTISKQYTHLAMVRVSHTRVLGKNPVPIGHVHKPASNVPDCFPSCCLHCILSMLNING